MKRKHFVLLTLMVWALVSTATAELHTDQFNVTVEGHNSFVGGGGSGWSGDGDQQGDWIDYNQTDWWNQWFYDDPPSDNRMKHIEYSIDISTALPVIPGPVTWGESYVEIALNWSNMDYPETGAGGRPPMPYEEQFINREIIFAEMLWNPYDPFFEPVSLNFSGEFDITEYNPEWVSIDVRVYSYVEWEMLEEMWIEDPDHPDGGFWDLFPMPVMELIPVDISGTIEHECIVPEPATLSLLAFGGLALLRKRK